MQRHRGKLFLSPPKLFKSEVALYFPNMQGYTLANSSGMEDTTSVFKGKTSIVSVFTGLWAENQTKTFVENPELRETVRELSKNNLQMVWVNIEADWMRAGLVRLFLGGLRKRLGKEEWGRYFVVRRGVEEEVKQDIAMVNSKVGYVYLVDEKCRIRWAGSGDAGPGEAEGLLRSVSRLAGATQTGKVLDEVRDTQGFK